MVNREKLIQVLRVQRQFIDESLGISKITHEITGFEYSQVLLEACAYVTYIETISNKADSLYRLIKANLTESITYSYVSLIKKIAKKIRLKEKEVVLAFDYTDEEFWGDVQGIEIHGAPKKEKCKGKFKFLTCSIVTGENVPKIPLISIPIHLGHYQTYAITHCLRHIEAYLGPVALLLFDRGFKAKQLRYTLDELGYPYLIFLPKDRHITKRLEEMETGETNLEEYNFKFSQGNSQVRGTDYLAFLKQIFDKRSNNSYDWSFATNLPNIDLNRIIKTYKQRWQIEIAFKVEDNALIKCNSREMKVRYFFFMYAQILHTQWATFHKEEVTFKQFIIELHKLSAELINAANNGKKKGKKSV